jgi:ATP-dependent DNA helicase RecG
VGDRRARVLEGEAGIWTLEDLLFHAPRRYLDRSSLKAIRDCFEGEEVTVSGRVVEVQKGGRKKTHLRVTVHDGTDTLDAVFFAGIRFFETYFQAGDEVLLSGRITVYRSQRQITHPEFDRLNDSDEGINTGRVVPLYPSTEKLKKQGFDSRGFRRIVHETLENHLSPLRPRLNQVLPLEGLPPYGDSLETLHFPGKIEDIEPARSRLAFHEALLLQYYLLLKKTLRGREEGPALESPDIHERAWQDVQNFINTLPFPLTGDQKAAIQEITDDMKRNYPMNRLLQGDVGSGKTLVACAAMLFASRLGLQSAFMVPTEVLARQHYATLNRFLGDHLRVEILTGTTPEKERRGIISELASGSLEVVTGTHALFQKGVSFHNLGLVIIDEQHRFGVDQRSRLLDKGHHPHQLSMTATPIPRSLSLTRYGDMEVSSIREKPAQRKKVTTHSFPESRLRGVYNSLEKYVSMGRQVFYILPLIDESEKLDLASAEKRFRELKKIFSHRKVELLHGRVPEDRSRETMESFTRGETDILVATTVIEVGVDVPNATIIVIEHADRFGLAQLHQLRGRVGRGEHESFCILIHGEDLSETAERRIHTMLETDDGFRIAEEDLQLRGAGELIGTRQHGHAEWMQFTDLSRDSELIGRARQLAREINEKTDNPAAALEGLKQGKVPPPMEGIRTGRFRRYLS